MYTYIHAYIHKANDQNQTMAIYLFDAVQHGRHAMVTLIVSVSHPSPTDTPITIIGYYICTTYILDLLYTYQLHRFELSRFLYASSAATSPPAALALAYEPEGTGVASATGTTVA
jgi:hypothetical protein